MELSRFIDDYLVKDTLKIAIIDAETVDLYFDGSLADFLASDEYLETAEMYVDHIDLENVISQLKGYLIIYVA